MTSPIEIKTQAISQDSFPGAYIEPLWSRMELIRKSPAYALRLLLGGIVTHSPRGRTDYVQLTFDGFEYCLHRSNYDHVVQVALQLSARFQAMNVYQKWSPEAGERMRMQPRIIIDGYEYAADLSIQMHDIPLERSRMLFITPDHSGCGYYRSKLPSQYIKHSPQYYVESTEFINYDSICWFDAMMMHRVPPDHWLSVFQNLKQAGKIILYEYDDDIFHIPDWNHNSTRYDAPALQRARIAMDMADIIICSTEQLREVSERPEVAFLGPNLIDFSSGKTEPLPCSRELDAKVKGYMIRRQHDKQFFIHPTRPKVASWGKKIEPIRVLWTGSNTHDEDLQEVIHAITELSREYGIAVAFIFFGYCPPQFLETYLQEGNTKPKFVVKEQFMHRIHYIEPVPFKHYYDTIRSIDPDIAICPLKADPFNLSKSPVKVLELGAMGIPVVATKYGPYEILQHNETGLLVEPGDKAAWIASIKTMIEQPFERQRLAKNLRQTVEREYSWQVDSTQRRHWDMIFQRIHELVQARRDAFLEGFPNESRDREDEHATASHRSSDGEHGNGDLPRSASP